VEFLAGSNNSVLIDNCDALQGVTVTLAVTEDLVTSDNGGFSLQLNCYPLAGTTSVGLALNWIQFVICVSDNYEDNSATFEWQAWALGATAFPPGYQVPPGTTNANQPVPPFPQPNPKITDVPSNQLPKGSSLAIALTTGPSPYGVTAAKFTVQLAGAAEQSVVLNFPAGNPDAQFPIAGFQVDLVGPGNLARATFTSGAGELTYSVVSGSLSVQDGGVGSACGQYQAVTGENSNVVYDPVTPVSGSALSQGFALASKVVASQAVEGGVFFLVNDGTVMFALDGTEAWPAVVVDKTATAFQALSASQVYVLGSDGNLWLEQGPWSAMTRVPVDGNVAAFQALSSSEAYVLGTDGNLWHETGPWATMTRTHVDGNVAAFQALSSSEAYVLGTDGNLWDEAGPWATMTRARVDGSVRAFQPLPSSAGDPPQAYVLGDDGTLWLEQGPWNTMTRVRADGNVAAFQALSASSAYVLGGDGNLWLESGPWASMTRAQVDGNVATFEAISAGQAYVIGTDGNLWNESGPWATVPPDRHQVGGGIYP
jgi:hypothetical protein